MKTLEDYQSGNYETRSDKEPPDSKPPTWANAVVEPPPSQQKVLEMHTNQQEKEKNRSTMDKRPHNAVVQGKATNAGIFQVHKVDEFKCKPMFVRCFRCQRTVKTVTKSSPSECFLFCCGLESLCCDECQEVEHRCPRCNVFLGLYSITFYKK